MGRLVKVLVVLLVIIIVIAAFGLYLYSQYENLDVDVDEGASGVSLYTTTTIELRIVLIFRNEGGRELTVPPTTYDAWADGVPAGEGQTEEVTVPANGIATTVTTLIVDKAQAPAAFLALIDAQKDKIRVKGDAHLDILGMTFDIPFDRTFSMQVP
jgi:LEA14-like dessication related protein